ncbi:MULTISPECIES: DUF4123 domain-containing protein [Pseudomonas]|uniref:DUF4123 domain-containing protein n=1 Tax=Pseudomonas TaxID=286 RepID=UPI001FF18A32|nr:MULTISPECIES: DUF4123 domain-containing protein [Pseudomonas]
MDLGETWQVERFVRRYFQGAGEMHRLRSLLSSQLAHSHRLPDAEVLRQFSRNLQNGHLCAYVYPYVPMARTRVPASEAAGRIDAPAARPAVRRPAKKPSVETDTLAPVLPPPAQPESQLTSTSPASRELLDRGWGRAWGIFIFAPAALPMSAIRLHLKKFLRVRTEDKKLLMFRYYDPRVLSVFLPTCTDEEFTKFLGPLNRLLVESDEGARWNLFDLEDQRLRIVSGAH